MEFLLHHMLQKQATENPEKVALIWGSERLTYKEIEQQARNVANSPHLKRSPTRRPSWNSSKTIGCTGAFHLWNILCRWSFCSDTIRSSSKTDFTYCK